MKTNIQHIEYSKKHFILLILITIAMTAINIDAFAGTTGGTWKSLSDLADSWLSGYLGKFLAVAGGVTSVVLSKFSQAGWITGIGVGVGVSQLPTILGSMVSAVV